MSAPVLRRTPRRGRVVYDGVFGGRSERSISKSVVLIVRVNGSGGRFGYDCDPEDDEPLLEMTVTVDGGMMSCLERYMDERRDREG